MTRSILVSAIFGLAILAGASQAVLQRMEQQRDGIVHRRSPSWQKVDDATASAASPKAIELTFALKLRNTAELHDQLMRVSSPKSADYGKLWTLAQVNELTAPREENTQVVIDFLRSFDEIAEDQVIVSTGGSGFVRVTVDVATAERILSTKYSTFKHETTGEVTLRCEEYSLPEKIADVVDFVAPTINFPMRDFHLRIEVRGSSSSSSSSSVLTPTSTSEVAPEKNEESGEDVEKVGDVQVNQNTPDSLRALYGVDDAMASGKSSARQAVTAFLHQYYSESDLQSFYKKYFDELLGTPISEVVGPNRGTPGVEASLDVEYMTVMGAGIPTEFWSFAGRQPDNTENEPFLDFLYLLDETADPPLVFSTSYGEDEVSVSLDYATRMNEEFQKNSLRGVTFLFASGDSGVGSAFGPCTTYTPQYPSDSPYVTAVGATTSVNPETGAGLSSGGFSDRWPMPEWQEEAVSTYLTKAAADAGVGLPDSSLFNSSGRAFPDVSAQGTGYVVINNGQTLPSVAGTSCSSPTFGGIVGMLNDARTAVGKSPMGFLNPFIYANPEIFTDVTSGNNPGCGTTGFEASAGWDPVTGYGTPNYPRMLEAAMALP